MQTVCVNRVNMTLLGGDCYYRPACCLCNTIKGVLLVSLPLKSIQYTILRPNRRSMPMLRKDRAHVPTWSKTMAQNSQQALPASGGKRKMNIAFVICATPFAIGAPSPSVAINIVASGLTKLVYLWMFCCFSGFLGESDI